MKCETTNTVLIFALGVFAVFDVIFALQAVFHSRDLRSLQIQASQSQQGLMQIQQFVRPLAADAMAYNQKNPNPELTRILQATQAKPAAQ